jgi:hypothetical protein
LLDLSLAWELKQNNSSKELRKHQTRNNSSTLP